MISNKATRSTLSSLSILALVTTTMIAAGCDVWGLPGDGAKPGKDSVADVDVCTFDLEHGCTPDTPDDVKH